MLIQGDNNNGLTLFSAHQIQDCLNRRKLTINRSTSNILIYYEPKDYLILNIKGHFWQIWIWQTENKSYC